MVGGCKITKFVKIFSLLLYSIYWFSTNTCSVCVAKNLLCCCCPSGNRIRNVHSFSPTSAEGSSGTQMLMLSILACRIQINIHCQQRLVNFSNNIICTWVQPKYYDSLRGFKNIKLLYLHTAKKKRKL